MGLLKWSLLDTPLLHTVRSIYLIRVDIVSPSFLVLVCTNGPCCTTQTAFRPRTNTRTYSCECIRILSIVPWRGHRCDALTLMPFDSLLAQPSPGTSIRCSEKTRRLTSSQRVCTRIWIFCALPSACFR